MKVEQDLSNHATKSDLKSATGVDASKFAKKADLTCLKSDVDELDIDKLKIVSSGLNNVKCKVGELDIDKLKPVPVDLKKKRVAVEKGAVKKIPYNEMVKKANAIDTSGFIKKKKIMMLSSGILKVKYLVLLI